MESRKQKKHLLAQLMAVLSALFLVYHYATNYEEYHLSKSNQAKEEDGRDLLGDGGGAPGSPDVSGSQSQHRTNADEERRMWQAEITRLHEGRPEQDGHFEAQRSEGFYGFGEVLLNAKMDVDAMELLFEFPSSSQNILKMTTYRYSKLQQIGQDSKLVECDGSEVSVSFSADDMDILQQNLEDVLLEGWVILEDIKPKTANKEEWRKMIGRKEKAEGGK